MNATEKFLAANAHVDEAAVQPLPNSRKVYIEGSRLDIQVPMREISQPIPIPPSVVKKTRQFMSTIVPGLTPTRRRRLISAMACLPCAQNGLPNAVILKNCPV
jgi:hypothetical protein